MNNTTTYPQYYRRAGKIMKVVSPVQAKVIILPPDAAAAERFTTTYPSEARMKEELSGMELVEEPTWRSFLDTFHSEVIEERLALNRLKRQENTKRELAAMVAAKPEPAAS
jgi:hypothetical protein